MYILYGRIGNWSEIDRDESEQEIVATIDECMRRLNLTEFMVKEGDDFAMPYKIIKNKKDFDKYEKEVYSKVKKLTKKK